MSDTDVNLYFTVPENTGGKRLDRMLSELLPDYSRTTIQNWIQNNQVSVDGKVVKRKHLLTGNECLAVQFALHEPISVDPEPIDLNVIWYDEHVIVLNKPAGLIVHPGAGNPSGTLMNGLLYHFSAQANLPRAGIVHRLDKNTTGLLAVARTEKARQSLTSQLANRTMKRVYQAVCEGVMIAGMSIDKPIARHAHDRLRMAISHQGKAAKSHVKTTRKFRSHTLIEVALETGRTHQIRVHLSSVGYPLVGDTRYGCRGIVPKGAGEKLRDCIRGFKHQALHASELSFNHPISGQVKSWQVEAAQDFQDLVELLQLDSDSDNIK